MFFPYGQGPTVNSPGWQRFGIGTHGPTTNPSVHQLIGGVVGLTTTIGGLTTATGPATGPVTNVTTGGVDV